MKSIIFICPYFGKLPRNHMPIWLESCKYNSSIDWLIITDDTENYDYPINVKVKYMSFDKLKQKIQKKFDFDLHIETAYKLCDFKPAYGYIFQDEIKNYDYWGHCDMSDCIFGDLRKFLTDERLSKADKIGFLGHMTLYLNDSDVNKRIFIKTKSNIPLSNILGSKENKAFDEINNTSINTIYIENGLDIERIDDIYYDISPLSYRFRQVCYDEQYSLFYPHKKREIFKWDKGKLYNISDNDRKLVKKELGYVHFQKRNMKSEISNKERYLIIPNKFVDYKKINYKLMKKICCPHFYFKFFILKWEALKYRIKHMI